MRNALPLTMAPMIDADTLVPAGTVYKMARTLDHAMANDASARAAYARIYGREWSPVSECTPSGAAPALFTDHYAAPNERTAM